MAKFSVNKVRPGVWIAAGVVAVLVLGGALVGANIPAQSGDATSTSNTATTKLADTAEPVPTVAAIEPAEGSVAGATITITGENLGDVTAVNIGDVPAGVTVVDEQTLQVVVPAQLAYSPVVSPVTVFAGETTVAQETPLQFSYVVATPVDRQLQYAFAHWNNYNLAEFGDLNPVGGDCMNFVSQTLLARGWPMMDGWSSQNAGGDWTAAWGHVPSFDNWLRDRPELGLTELSFDQRDQVKLGDLVVFDWDGGGSLDHIQIVSAIQVVDGKTIIKMVGHNTDSDYRDFDTVITVDHPGATGYFWSVP